jgi:MYXO-CTERM domain-containing protein
VEIPIMKNIYRALCSSAAVAVATITFVSQAQAAPVVYIDPVSQDVALGGTATVGIWVMNLTDPVGGVSLTLSFDDSLLAGLSYTVDPDDGMGTALDPFNDLSFGFGTPGPGDLDLFFFADFTETEASLAAKQGGSFRLAEVSFLGLADGHSPLTLSNVLLSNWDGTSTLADVTSQNGSICVGGNCNTVPEPSSYGLAAIALLAAGAAGRSRRRKTLA